MGTKNAGHSGPPSDTNVKKRGIYKKLDPSDRRSDDELRVAEFSYQNDALAELIEQVWTNQDKLEDKLIKETNYVKRSRAAQDALADRGIHLSSPMVITETEYYNGYTAGDDEEVVFVLPNKERADTSGSSSLLEAAKLLMACRPNGI
jgi:hypothetical protein